MNNYIIKNENGEIITNSAERNIILLRYAAFLNENNEGNVNFPVQMNMHQATTAITIPELSGNHQTIIAAAPQVTQTKKSTKASAIQQQNSQQGANVAGNQKLSGLQCHLCSKVLCNSQYLSQHIRVVHENIREHGCAYCDMKFGSKSHLIIHERKHTGERPYTCEVCNKGFAQKSLYSYHKKRAHTSSNNNQ